MGQRQLSEEHKEKLAEGRRLAKAAREAEQAVTGSTVTDETAEDEAPARPTRLSLRDKHRNVLTTDDVPPGYVGRWVNDEGTRIKDFQSMGYVFVTDSARGRVVVGDPKVDAQRQTGTVVSKLTKKMDAANKPVISYLMAQRHEWYDEDQAFKQEKILEAEKQLSRQAEQDGLVSAEQLRRA